MEKDNNVRIAVLEEQIRGMREQQKLNAESTEKLFNTLFQKVDDLSAVMNRGKGAFAASMVLAGAIGAFLMKIGTLFINPKL